MSSSGNQETNTSREQLDDLDTEALESALPQLTSKLADLARTLDDEEYQVLSSIITSASRHLAELQDINAEARYVYAKPISAAATQSIRAKLIELPDTLGFSE